MILEVFRNTKSNSGISLTNTNHIDCILNFEIKRVVQFRHLTGFISVPQNTNTKY